MMQILELRELELDAASEQRIRTCTDPELLARWATRATRANTETELFDP